MKRMLAALMLITFLSFSSPPAEAAASAGVTFSIACSIDPAQPAYVGEEFQWRIEGVFGGSGQYLYAFQVYKNGVEVDSVPAPFLKPSSTIFAPTSPGKYKMKARVQDTGNRTIYEKFSQEITVLASVNKITKVEPTGATGLRITWNTVPGATEYYLFRSADMKNWDMIKATSTTCFLNTYLKAGTRYFYSVQYYRPGLFWCEFSSSAAGVPMAKTRITSITSPSAGRVQLAWAKADGATGYQVAMATSVNGNYKSVRVLPGTIVTFSGIKSGSALFFKVRPYRRVYTTTYWGVYTAPRAIKVK